MKRPTKVMSVETYQQLISVMTIIAIACAALGAFCMYMIWQYSIKKDHAAVREERWTDNHKNTAALSFQFSDINGKDLGFLYATIYTITKTDSGNVRNGGQNFRAKESVFYLPEGIYFYEIETADYETVSYSVGIGTNEIGQRIGPGIALKPKIYSLLKE
ncbi:MAG: hypothetical protein IPG01_13265 [Chitinophagaceae bacterium]|nr:hypothetical protein [Chitinophagaceae bacterium]